MNSVNVNIDFDYDTLLSESLKSDSEWVMVHSDQGIKTLEYGLDAVIPTQCQTRNVMMPWSECTMTHSESDLKDLESRVT